MKNVLIIFYFLSLGVVVHAQALIGGVVKDRLTKEPIPYVSVVLNSTFRGTSTDTEGAFLLEIPNYRQSNTFTFKIVGYKEKTIGLVDLMRSDVVLLEIDEQELEEVVLKPVNAAKLIKEVATKIPQNHYSNPLGQEVFYRSTMVANKELNIIEEAHYDIINTFNEEPMTKNVTIHKARAYSDLTSFKSLGKIVANNIEDDSLDIERSTQLILGFNPDLEQLQSNKDGVFGKNSEKNYHFTYGGLAIKNDVVLHIINFNQIEGVKKTLFKGTIYIDTASLAIVEFDVRLSPEGIDFQKFIPLRYKILMKLGGYSIEVKEFRMQARYTKYDNYWVVNKGLFNMIGNISRRNKISLDANFLYEFSVLRSYPKTQFYRRDTDYSFIASDIIPFKNNYFFEHSQVLPMRAKTREYIDNLLD